MNPVKHSGIYIEKGSREITIEIIVDDDSVRLINGQQSTTLEKNIFLDQQIKEYLKVHHQLSDLSGIRTNKILNIINNPPIH